MRRGKVPLTRHIHAFDTPIPLSTESNYRNPDKKQLRAHILAMIKQGMSYRQIAAEFGIHWTRVCQIAKAGLDEIKPQNHGLMKK
jgi:DNA invertase Pin-like site-specific DNA recombinase